MSNHPTKYPTEIIAFCCAGDNNPRISLHCTGGAQYFVMVELSGKDATKSPVQSFNDAHAAYIATVLMMSEATCDAIEQMADEIERESS